MVTKRSNYQQFIKELDYQIDQFINSINESIDDIQFDFDKSISLHLNEKWDKSVLESLKGKKGIYFFEIDLDSIYLNQDNSISTIDNLIEDWNKKKEANFYSSAVVKSRYELNKFKEKKWLPLYIGKCKNIYKRVVEHIELLPEKKTYAMKLLHRNNLENALLRVSILEIDAVNYDFIVPFFEKTLRGKYYPIIGKQ